MAFLGSPPENEGGEFVSLPDDVYEAVVADVAEVPNGLYNPDTDSDTKKTQFQWDFRIREDALRDLPPLGEDERYSNRMRMWSGSALGRHPKNKLTNTVRTIDKEFDIEKGYDSFEDFRNKVVCMPVRLIVKTEAGKKYAKVVGTMPSRAAVPPMAELIRLGIVSTSDGDDLPF